MHVIRHQAPAEHADVRLKSLFGEQPQVREPIEVGFEHRAAIDAALGDVMRHAGTDATLPSWHNLCPMEELPRAAGMLRELGQIRLSLFFPLFFPLDQTLAIAICLTMSWVKIPVVRDQ